MKVTIEKKTDQLNFEDFLGGMTRVVTVAGVKSGTKEQQYDVQIEGDARWWRPPPTVLKLLVIAWGDDATEWVGRRAELYGDPDIMFGRDRVGGIRVSRLSHITKPIVASLTETRGKRKMHTVDPLPDLPTAPAPIETPLPERINKAIAAFGDMGVTVEMLETRVGPNEKWSAAELDLLTPIIMALKSGATTVEAEFAPAPTQAPA